MMAYPLMPVHEESRLSTYAKGEGEKGKSKVKEWFASITRTMSTEPPSRYKGHISRQGTPTDKDDWLNLKAGHDQVRNQKDGAAKDKEGQVGGSALSPFLA